MKSDIFDLCLHTINTRLDGVIINHNVQQQTICDFICLSIRYYLRQKVQKSNALDENERILLSTILPYFQMDPKDYQLDSALPSGLFSMFQNPLSPNNLYDGMVIDPMQFKQILVKELNRQNDINVITRYFKVICYKKRDENIFFFQETSKEQLDANTHNIHFDKDRLTFWSQNRFTFVERNIYMDSSSGFVIPIIDNYDTMDWAMWIRKRLEICPDTNGYWKLLNQYDEPNKPPVVSCKHLDAISALLKRDELRNLNKNEQSIKFIFLRNHQTKYRNEDICGEYILSFWNGKYFGNTALSLRILKSMKKTAVIKPKKKYHFLHYRSMDDINWSHFDGDKAKYVSYDQNDALLKQLECSYRAVITFPSQMKQFQNKNKTRLFNCVQLPELAKIFEKVYIMKFNFDPKSESAKITNIEQIEVRGIWDQFPCDLQRQYLGKNSILGEREKLSNLGTINIEIKDENIAVSIEFEENKNFSICKRYHFSRNIPAKNQNRLVRLLQYWRRDSLFSSVMIRNKLIISQSKISQDDRILSTKLIDLTGSDHANIDRKNENEIGLVSDRNRKRHEIRHGYRNRRCHIKTYKDLMRDAKKAKLTSCEWDVMDKFDQERQVVELEHFDNMS